MGRYSNGLRSPGVAYEKDERDTFVRYVLAYVASVEVEEDLERQGDQ